MMYQRLTSTRGKDHPQHYCPQCADQELEVQTELDLARQEGALEISKEVTREVCSSCGRPITDVPTEVRTYRIEVDITFTVSIDLPSLGATVAEYALADALGEVTYENAVEDIKDTIYEGVEIALEKVNISSYHEEIGEAKVVPPEQNTEATWRPLKAPFR